MDTLTPMRSKLGLTLSAVGLGLAVNTVALSSERLPPAPDLRTPLGLIDEGGCFTLHYTGYSDLPRVGKYGSLGVLRLKLARP
jgi:hypothetical protein